jgi:membrane protein
LAFRETGSRCQRRILAVAGVFEKKRNHPMSLRASVRVFVRAARQFGADGASQMGAALAYYALFSTAPLLVLAVMFSGLIFGQQAARDRVRKHLTEIVGPETAREVNSLMERSVRPENGRLAAALGGATLVLGALSVFLHIRRCLCVIWRLDSSSRSGAISTLLNYLLAIVMVLAVGILLFLSLAASTAVPWLVDRLGKDFPVGTRFWHWLDAGFSFALLTVFFALVFHVMSGRRILLRHVVYGSVISALLFTAGKTVIGLYLAYTGMGSAYGAAGSLVVFLVWVYYSAQIVFFGAELVQARRTRAEWLPNARLEPANATA